MCAQIPHFLSFLVSYHPSYLPYSLTYFHFSLPLFPSFSPFHAYFFPTLSHNITFALSLYISMLNDFIFHSNQHHLQTFLHFTSLLLSSLLSISSHYTLYNPPLSQIQDVRGVEGADQQPTHQLGLSPLLHAHGRPKRYVRVLVRNVRAGACTHECLCVRMCFLLLIYCCRFAWDKSS